MDLAKRKILMKAFTISHFNYCPLIWMIHSGQLNNQINKTNERALRLVYKDNKRNFNDLLELLQLLYTNETFRYMQQKYLKKNSLAPEVMTEIFK